MKNQFLKKNWWLFLLFIIAVVIWTLVAVKYAFAHPGNTDSYGCHTCRTNCPKWGLSYGEYHCHNAKYTTPEPAYTPPVITYSWNGQTYTSLDTYNTTKRSDIKGLYKKILERDPYSDSEVDNYFNSGKDYKEIEQEFYSSDEYKKIQEAKQAPATPPTQSQTITPTATAMTTEPESEDNSFWWWFVPVLALIGGIAYASHKKQE